MPGSDISIIVLVEQFLTRNECGGVRAAVSALAENMKSQQKEPAALLLLMATEFNQHHWPSKCQQRSRLPGTCYQKRLKS